MAATNRGKRSSYTEISPYPFFFATKQSTIRLMRIGHATPGNKALRAGRASEANRAYIVTFVTEGRIRWLEELFLARIVCRAVNQARGQDTLCYVVMPDHVHWLLALSEGVSLPRPIQFVKAYSAFHINKRLERRGKFWQAGFHDHALRREEELVRVARYIVSNPLRAGLCDRVGEYPHWDAVWL